MNLDTKDNCIWLVTDTEFWTNTKWYLCSFCDFTFDDRERKIKRYKYCPGCGKKIILGEIHDKA